MAKIQGGQVLGVPGRARTVAKIGLEEVLWARVGWSHLKASAPEFPAKVPPTDVLSTAQQWKDAVAECQRLGLPRHVDGPKNWDAMGAVSTVLHELGTDIRVLDAGAARYSTVLTSLAMYRVRELVGNNLEFDSVRNHRGVRFEPGDVTETCYRDGWFDAVTCMSVIEHGVPVEEFLAESARLLRPGGLLVVSTDYSQQPPDTTGKVAYGVQVRIFGPSKIEDLVANAASHGLRLQGELALEHTENVVTWKRMGLDYTFIRLTFVKV